MLKARGVGYGAAFAVIVLTLVIIMGVVKIAQTYNAAQTALQQYAEAAQKPQLAIASYRATENGITIEIVNKGPGGVYIKQVYLYKEGSDGIPTEAVPATGFTGAYLPLGQSIRVYFNETDIDTFVFWHKPLRILVETDKGVVDLAYKTVVSKAYINIHLPDNYIGTPSLQLEVESPVQPTGLTRIDIPFTSLNECGSPMEPDLDGINEFTWYICRKGKTVTVMMTVVAGVEYQVTLKGNIQVPAIQQQEGNWGMPPAFQAKNVELDYSSRFFAAPGGAATVDFKIPDVAWINKGVNFYRFAGSYTIDFSWLYKARLKTEKFEGTGVSPGYGFTGRGDDTDEAWMAILTVTGNILASGAVSAFSPAGCPVYPEPIANDLHPPIPDEIKDEIRQWLISEFGGVEETDHAVHSGIPIIIYGFPRDCPYFSSEGTLLSVTVQLDLPPGKVLVIPVFSWDDKDGSGNLPVEFYVQVLNRDGYLLGANYAFEEEDTPGTTEGAYMTFEGAIPITVNSGGGWHVLRIDVLRVGPYGGSMTDRNPAALILSKVIILRYADAAINCLYRHTHPGVPWVVIDLSTGRVDRYSIANVLPVALKAEPPSTSTGDYEDLIGTTVELLRGDHVLTLRVDGDTADSDVYFNNLRTSITGTVYVGGTGTDERIEEYELGVGVHIYGSDDIVAPWSGTLLDPGKTASSLMGQGYTLVAYAKYEHMKLWGDCPDGPEKHVYLRLTFRLPYTGTSKYYIVFPVKFAASADYKEPPEITATGGTINFVHLTPDGLERIVIVEASRGATVQVDIDLGLPECVEGITWPNAYVFAGVGGIVVLENYAEEYNLRDNVVGVGQAPTSIGTILIGVQESPYGVARMRYIDARTGVQAGDLVDLVEGATNIVSIRYLDEYLGINVWTYPFHELYVIVEGVPCAQQTSAG